MENLGNRAISGLIWNLLERVGIQIVGLFPTIILARLLTPEQFGLIGMLTIFIAVSNTFLDSGFGVALIQKKDATYLDECSIFYFNILVGVVAVIVLYFTAPYIADFFNQPILTGLMRWLSLDILINAFSLIQTTLLTRKLDFRTQLQASLFATLVSGVIGVGAAYLGWGVWSLVIQAITGRLIDTITLWLMCSWRPAPIFSLDALKGMFGFGSRMLFSSLAATFFDNLNQVFISKVFSVASLGYYTRAASMRWVVIDTTSDTVGRVLYPALAAIQDDPKRLKSAYRRSMLLTTFIHFPMMTGLIVVARPLIYLLFSAQWENSVLFFQLMCAAGLLYPLQVINLDILKVKGRSDLFFRLTVIKRSLLILTIIVTYRWGINAMLIGQIVNSLIAYSLNSYYSEKLIDYPVKAQILDVFPSLLISCLMSGGLWIIGNILQTDSNLVILAIQVSVGPTLYFALHLIFRTEPMSEGYKLVQKLFTNIAKPKESHL